jgi:hypothetical protein
MINENRWIVAIIVSLTIFVLSPAFPQVQEASINKTVRVLIKTFTPSDKSDNQNNLGDVSVFVQLSLQKYPSVQIVGNDTTVPTENAKLRSGVQQRNEMLSNVDYIISGNYNIADNKITVFVDLFKQDDGKVKNTICTGELDKIGPFMDDMGRQIFSSILELEGISQKKIAIIYHLDKENTKDNNKITYSSQLSREIVEYFPGMENIKMMGWQDEISYQDKTDEEILKQLGADAYFDLGFNFKKDNFTSISPRFILKAGEGEKIQIVKLPTYSIDYYRNILYSTFVINELSGFLNSLYDFNKGITRAYSLNSASRDALLTLADTSSARGDFNLSNHYIYTFIDQNPDMKASRFIEVHNKLGKNKRSLYRTDEAEEEFNKVLTLEAANYDANLSMAALKLENDDYEGVLLQLAPLPVTDPINLIKGQAYYGLGLYMEARNSLETVTKVSKDELYTKSVILGAVYLELNERQKAIQVYRNLYISNPNNEDIKYLYGYLLTLQGIDEFNKKNFKTATDLLATAQKIYKSADVTDYLRKSYINEGRYGDAMTLIENEITAGSYNENYIYLTHALDVRELFIAKTPVDTVMGLQIITLLNKHLSINPKEALAYYYKGNTLTRLGNGLEGLAQMELSYDLDQGKISSQLDLMELYLLNNKFKECENFFYRINKLNTATKESKLTVTDRDLALMYYLLITALDIQNKDFKKYQSLLDKLLAKHTDVNFWDYNSYLSWLETADIPQDKKTRLQALTAEMSDHDETTKNKIAEKTGD